MKIPSSSRRRLGPIRLRLGNLEGREALPTDAGLALWRDEPRLFPGVTMAMACRSVTRGLRARPGKLQRAAIDDLQHQQRPESRQQRENPFKWCNAS
jgi:hypothetical protein